MQDFLYAGMNPLVLVGWIAITTIAGVLSRKLLRAPSLFGTFGDMAVGIFGVFGLGWVLQQFEIDVSEFVISSSVRRETAIWIDAALVALLGSLIIRLILKPLSEQGGD